MVSRNDFSYIIGTRFCNICTCMCVFTLIPTQSSCYCVSMTASPHCSIYCDMLMLLCSLLPCWHGLGNLSVPLGESVPVSATGTTRSGSGRWSNDERWAGATVCLIHYTQTSLHRLDLCFFSPYMELRAMRNTFMSFPEMCDGTYALFRLTNSSLNCPTAGWRESQDPQHARSKL